MLLLLRCSHIRWGKFATAEISEMLLLGRCSNVSRVKPARGERSLIALLFLHSFATLSGPSSNLVRCVANSSPVKSLMLAFFASRRVKVAISSAVIGVPGAIPSASSMAARRLASGMDATCAVAVSGKVRHINREKVKRRNCLSMDPLLENI